MPETMSEKYIGYAYTTQQPLQDADIYKAHARLVNKVANLERIVDDIVHKMEKMGDNGSECLECENFSRHFD